MGIFDVFGGSQTMPTGAPEQGFDLGDRLMSPLSQIGLQLLANNGRPTTEGMFNGIPQALATGAKYQNAKRKEAEEKAKQHQTLEYLRKNDPEMAGLVDSGLDIEQAFNYSLRKQEFAAEQARASKGPGPTDAQLNYEYGLKNPDFARQLESGRASRQPVEIQAINERAAMAPQYGLDPNTPEGKAWVLTGKLPSADRTVTAGDRKAIREDDDMVFSADQAGETLKTVEEMSPKAYEGFGSGVRSFLGNNVYDGVMPDWLASPEASAATTQMDQAVTQGALEQLRTTFGGNPTEGERQILLEVQGSSSQPEPVRREIFKRARKAIERRRQFHSERASELRDDTYYDAPKADAGSAGAAPADPLGLR